MHSYIYKIHSNDNKMNYYGLTTKTILSRFNQHLSNYNAYIKKLVMTIVHHSLF